MSNVKQSVHSIPDQLALDIEYCLKLMPEHKLNCKYKTSWDLAEAFAKHVFDKSRPLAYGDIVKLNDGSHAQVLHRYAEFNDSSWYVAPIVDGVVEDIAIIEDISIKDRIK